MIMASQITLEKSYAITNTKFILTVLIVFLHCTLHVDKLSAPSETFINIDTLFKILFDAATPAFFAISAYLLFRNFSFEKYGDKLVSRFKSLLIPFVIFQIVGFIIPFIFTFIRTKEFEWVPLNEFVVEIANQSYNPPLWFLVTLFQFAIFSPAIWILFKRFGGKGAMIGGGFFYIMNLLDKSSYISIFFWMPIIILGAYMGYREMEGKKSFWDVSWKWGLALIPVIIATFFLWSGDYSDNIYYTYRLVGGTLIIILLGGAKFKPFVFERFMMFVYCTHWPAQAFGFFIPKTEMFAFIRPVYILVLCTFVGWVLNRYLPKLYSVLSGSR